jgi:hypothetical protein
MHFIQGQIKDGLIDMQLCPSSEKVAAILTNPFTKKKFVPLRDILGVRDTST